MYYASTLINRVLISTASITIIDGQNEEAIAKLIDNDYNPCLPEAMHSDKRITITFSSNIASFSGWYPSICTNRSHYVNEYMFDSAQKWTFSNLVVEDYVVTDGYGLVRTESYHGDITCDNCSFINVQNSGSTHLFVTWGSFHFRASDFIGISLDGSYLINADHAYTLTGGNREFVIKETNFINITTAHYLIFLQVSWNDVKWLVFKNFLESMPSHFSCTRYGPKQGCRKSTCTF